MVRWPERVYESRDGLGSSLYPLVRAVRCPRCGLDLPYDYAWLVNYALAAYKSLRRAAALAAGRRGGRRARGLGF